jgi:hypothetical protein
LAANGESIAGIAVVQVSALNFGRSRVRTRQDVQASGLNPKDACSGQRIGIGPAGAEFFRSREAIPKTRVAFVQSCQANAALLGMAKRLVFSHEQFLDIAADLIGYFVQVVLPTGRL